MSLQTLTNDSLVQLLRIRSIGVIQLSQNCIQSVGIWTIHNEMLQKPNVAQTKSDRWIEACNSLACHDVSTYLAAASVTATHISLFWVTRMAFSTFSSISGRPAYIATTGAILVTPSIWQSTSQPQRQNTWRSQPCKSGHGKVFVQLWYLPVSSLPASTFLMKAFRLAFLHGPSMGRIALGPIKCNKQLLYEGGKNW